MQSVADAAVLTAAQEARRSNSNYATVAIEDAERNGFKAGGSVKVSLSYPYKPITRLLPLKAITLTSSSQSVIAE